MDANAKLGSNIIQGDPNLMSNNGKILMDLAQRQNLTIGNLSNKCRGIITRHRKTAEAEEKSILDYLLFCDMMEPFFNTMIVDEERHHVLKKICHNQRC